MIISKLPRLLAVVAAVAGGVAWVIFSRAGLVLSHYDAKAHLVVARRVFDNLTPGWQQIGAVWLPLPHLIDLLPVQIDFFYRTGLFASLVSVACLATTTYVAAQLVLRVTGSAVGACVSAAYTTHDHDPMRPEACAQALQPHHRGQPGHRPITVRTD